MSEERFAAIERTLDSHTRTLDDLETGQDEMRLHLIRIDGRLDRVEGRLDRIEINVEQMKDDIKQIAEGHAVTQAAIARSTEEVIAHIDRKIAPLEIAVRAHFGTT